MRLFPIEKVCCPVMGQRIDIGLCFEIVDVFDNILRADAVPELGDRYNEVNRKVCRGCPKREDLTTE